MTIRNHLTLREHMRRLGRAARAEWIVRGWEIVAGLGVGIVCGILIGIGLMKLAGGA